MTSSMILGRLTNKLRRQTLNDNETGAQVTPQPLPAVVSTRKSARLNPGLFGENTGSVVENDDGQKLYPQERLSSDAAGGEDSDEDLELEQLDKMSTASIGIRSIDSGHVYGKSPPTLTSSPPMISEIDTNSWDSAGCESGIELRESAERDDDADFFDRYHTTSSSEHEPSTPIEKHNGFPMDFSGLSTELEGDQERSMVGGAFKPVKKSQQQGESRTPPIGEKRRWEISAVSGLQVAPGREARSPIASRTRSHDAPAEDGRAKLTAKRTIVKVKVLYYNSQPVRSAPIPISTPRESGNEFESATPVLSESPPNNPSYKRGRRGERPSLDFNKMREQMMGPTIAFQPAFSSIDAPGSLTPEAENRLV